MAFIFNLPDVGEGMAEGEIVSWFVKEGDSIKEDAPLLELQNDKLLQEIPSPVTGTIGKILVQPGTVASVGTALVEIITDGSAPVAKSETKEVVKEETKETVKTEVKEEAVVKPVSTVVNGQVLAMPSVRRYASLNNVDLSKVTATGHKGHVTKTDVDNFVSNPVSEMVAPVQTESKALQVIEVSGTGVSREKMSPTRKAISKAMVRSKHTAPHVTIFDEVEVTSLVNHRKKFKGFAAEKDIKLTYLAYVTKAVAMVLKKYPVLNSSVDDVNEEIVYKHFFNVGIAVDTENGLFVPNIKNVDQKGIFKIAAEIDDLAGKAHDRTLKSDEMKDGTFTISNIGSARGAWFTPVINFPEVAILGLGSVVEKPIVLEDKSIGVGQVMLLSLSFDHRVIDGKLAQLAMNELKRLLNNIDLLLMEA